MRCLSINHYNARTTFANVSFPWIFAFVHIFSPTNRTTGNKHATASAQVNPVYSATKNLFCFRLSNISPPYPQMFPGHGDYEHAGPFSGRHVNIYIMMVTALHESPILAVLTIPPVKLVRCSFLNGRGISRFKKSVFRGIFVYAQHLVNIIQR